MGASTGSYDSSDPQRDLDYCCSGPSGAETISFIKTCPAFAIVLNPEYQVVSSSEFMLQVLGYTCEEITGLDYLENFVAKEDRERIRIAFENGFDTGDFFTVEILASSKNHKQLLIEWTYRVVCKPDGEIDYFIGIGTDITERRETEKKQRMSEQRFRNLFDQSPISIALLEPGGEILKVNKAYEELWGLSEEQIMTARFNILKDKQSEELGLMPYIEAGFTKGASRLPPVFYDSIKTPSVQAGNAVWISCLVYPVKDETNTVQEVVFIHEDITERVKAEKKLKEKTEEYRSIFEAANDGFAIFDSKTVQIVEVNPAFCQMHGFSREKAIGLHPSTLKHPTHLENFEEHLKDLMAGESQHYQALHRRTDGSTFYADITTSHFTYQGKPHLLGVYRDVTEKVLAYQLLEQRVEERTREIATLLKVSADMASILELKPLLNLILDQLKKVVDYQGVAILTREGDEISTLAARRPNHDFELIASKQRYKLDQVRPMLDVVTNHEPLIIHDMQDTEAPITQSFLRVTKGLPETLFSHARTMLAVPMEYKGKFTGLLSLTHSEPNYYTSRHAELAMAFASQAAIAIENARLYEKAQETAALEERQRLARDLHDSVSQALFGISVGTGSMKVQLERDPSKLGKTLEYVSSLAQAGMAEMRALLFELRPESLEKEGLVVAFSKQVKALEARYGLQFNFEFGTEPDVTIKVKEALYRIGQESMNNTVKHAEASTISLCLKTIEGYLVLEIEDNGKGFDTGDSFPGHLGLHTMRERASRLGGTLQISSKPGAGTRIQVNIPIENP